MDETGINFDISKNKTVDFVGKKSIDGHNTGHEKDRFTACLTITGDDQMLMPYVLLAKLKKVRNKTKCPNNFGVFFIWDQHESHTHHEIVNYIKELGNDVLFIPVQRLTYSL